MNKYYFLLAFLFFGFVASAQDFLISDPSIVTCNGFLYDTGGTDGDYLPNQDIQTTVCSGAGQSSADASHVILDFLDIDLSFGDELSFYDGTDISARFIGSVSEGVSGGLKVKTTATNTTGCMTLRFQSTNAIRSGHGWKARIQCGESCQELNSVLTSTIPSIDNGTIDICLGETVTFNSDVSFPQNGFAYNQSANDCLFTWDFDDKSTAVGKSVSHTFDKAGGYNISLIVYDVKGCIARENVSCQVRVAAQPEMSVVGGGLSPICPGDTVILNSNLITKNSYIDVEPQTVSFVQSEIFSDELFLPDGFDEYNTKIELNGFKPAARIESVDDIVAINVNMEHSYLLDLGVKISCPNGSSVDLVQFGGFISDRKVVLGEPLENPDNPCDNAIVAAGVGYDYSWSKTSTNGTWTTEALALPKNTILPFGDYSPEATFDALIGCPINGEWTLSISDNIACDNGWVFSWGIDLNKPESYAVDSFKADILDYYWDSPAYDIGSDNNNLNIAPENAGNSSSIFVVEDEFGCTYRDTVIIELLSRYDAQCRSCDIPSPPIEDLDACIGKSLIVDAAINQDDEDILIYENNRISSFQNAGNSIISVDNFYPEVNTNTNKTIKSISLDIECENSNDLIVELVSPNNKTIRLINAGDINNTSSIKVNLVRTSFNAISNYSSDGNYLPSQTWQNLSAADVNGDWTLNVSTNDNSTTKINSWGFDLVPVIPVEYSWTGDNLDCTDCKEVEIVVDADQSLSVDIADVFGCTQSKSIEVNAIDNFAAPTPEIEDMRAGDIIYIWEPVPEVLSYLVKVNDSVWKPSQSLTRHVVSGHSVGDIVDFQIKSVGSDGVACDEEIASLRTVYDNCFMEIEAQEFTPIKCFGTPTGAIFVDVTITSVTLPVEYKIDNGPWQGSSLFTGIASGTYTLTVRDGDGCEEMDEITLLDPPPVVGNAVATDITCNGLVDGEVTSSATGGLAPYIYYWDTSPFTTFDASAVDLPARDYTVTIKDDNGCEVKETVTVGEPVAMTNSSVITHPTCFGGHNGSIELTIAGGTPSYDFAWNDLSVTQDLNNIEKGNYTYTVTDSRGCTASEDLIVTEPSALSIPMTTTDILCNGDATGTASVLPSGSMPFQYNWSNDNTINSQNNLDLLAGNYDLTITDNDGCISYSSGNIDEPAILDGTIASIDILCNGESTGSAQISVSGGVTPYLYNWNDANNQSTSVISNIPAGDYVVTVSDGNSCSVEKSVTINQAALAVLSTSQIDVGCATATNGQAEVIVSGGVQPFSYLWNDPLGQISNVAVGLSPGNYTVSISDGNNCLKTVDFTIGIVPKIVTIDSVQMVSPICAGQNNGSITVFTTGGQAPYSYLWDDPLAQIAEDANYLVGGVYNVEITDAANCVTTQEITLIEPLPLDATFDVVDVSCKDDATGQVELTTVGGTAPYNFQWNDASFQTTETAEDLIAGSYLVTISDSHNCTVEKMMDIVEPATKVEVSLSQDVIGCFGSNGNDVSSVVSGGTPGYVYTWGNGSSTPNVSGVGSGDLSLIVTDATGCTIDETINVTELEEITADFLYLVPTCYGLPDGKIGVNSVNGGDGNNVLSNYNFIWNTDPVQNTEIAENLAGNSDYLLTISDATGCSETFDLSLGEAEPINIGYTKNDVNCYGYDDGTINIDNVTGGLPPYTASWGQNANNSHSVSVYNLEPDSYIVTVTDSKGCTEAEEIEILEPEIFNVDFVVENTNCHGDSNGKIVSEAIGGTGPFDFVWDNGETTSTIEKLTPGTYKLSLTDDNGCTVVGEEEILPPYSIGANIHTIPTKCTDTEDGILKVYAIGGIYPYEVKLEEAGNFENEEIYSDLAAGDYRVYVKDSLECVWDTIVTIEHAPEFTIDAGGDVELFYGDSHEFDLEIANAAGTPDFEWSGNEVNSLDCSYCMNPVSTPNSTEYYTIYAIDENGCHAEDRVKVSIENYRKIEVPTGFSPNGDGKNDELIVHGKTRFIDKILVFEIFDQWGQMVHRDQDFGLNDETHGWDGIFRGKELLPGVYTWRLEVKYADGYQDQITGHTTLVK